tara:strand:+ start:1652 stop:2356 length:705 start_codon:yes stop_codon:yes gene_type:complete
MTSPKAYTHPAYTEPRCRKTYMPITRESMAIRINLDDGEGGNILTIETHHLDTLNYLEEEHRLIHNTTFIKSNRSPYHPNSIMALDWAHRSKPFQALSPIDLTLALIAEQIFGCPYYADGPMILISQTIDGDYFETTMSEDNINRAFRELYDIRHRKEMIREEARNHILSHLNHRAAEMESCSADQRFAMDMIKRFLDRTNANDMAINLDEITNDLMPNKDRDLCYNLLDALDE